MCCPVRSAAAQCLHFERAAGGDGDVPTHRRRLFAGRRPMLHAARASAARSADLEFWALGPPIDGVQGGLEANDLQKVSRQIGTTAGM